MLSKLLIDHDHIRRTLNLLEIQFLDLCRGRSPDFSIMLSIVVYVQEYPEHAHHPLEDAIFATLIKKHGDEAKLARDLLSDHTELESITRKLRDSLEAIKSGAVTEAELKHQLAEFLSRQRRHIYIEEIKIYPLLERVLTKLDWDAIQSMVAPINDPVFGDRTRNDYERLYAMIEGGHK